MSQIRFTFSFIVLVTFLVMRERNRYSISSNGHRAVIVIWSITCIGVVANNQAVRELFIALFIIAVKGVGDGDTLPSMTPVTMKK